MSHRRYEYDVDDEVDRQRMLTRDKQYEDMTPDEYRKTKYGVDGTKFFICQITPGVFTVKIMGKNHGATTKERIMQKVDEALTERFGL